MLPVTIHKDQYVTGGKADAAFDGGAVTDVVRMAVDIGSGLLSNFCLTVTRAVINDDNFGLWVKGFNLCNNLGDGLRFVISRYDDREAEWVYFRHLRFILFPFRPG